MAEQFCWGEDKIDLIAEDVVNEAVTELKRLVQNVMESMLEIGASRKFFLQYVIYNAVQPISNHLLEKGIFWEMRSSGISTH